MSKVFIGYRHTTPDQELARELEAHLSARGHDVFIDSKMHVGTNWVDEIDKRLREAQFFVVLLSEQSILSAMLAHEVTLAFELAAHSSLKILPIRMKWQGALPYDLEAYLHRVQYALWQEGMPWATICQELWEAIEESTELPCPGGENGHSLSSLAQATEEGWGAPLPSADLRLAQETDALRPRSPYYVRREQDDKIEALLRHSLVTPVTIVLKAPHQFGKSSLFARVYASARNQALRTIYVDFKLVPTSSLTNVTALMQSLIGQISRAVKLEPGSYAWDSGLDPPVNMTHFMELVLWSEAETGIALFLDDADRLFGSPHCQDFFAMVRHWHDERAFCKPWDRLSLLIAHSTTPTRWIQNVNQSPFNVGFRHRLPPFSVEQVTHLNQLHGRPLHTAGEVDGLMRLVDGHPYLVRQALFVAASHRWTLEKVESVALEHDGPFGDHLRSLLWALRSTNLDGAMRSVLRRQCCDKDEDFYRLEAAGMVKGEYRRSVTPANMLYSRYFGQHL